MGSNCSRRTPRSRNAFCVGRRRQSRRRCGVWAAIGGALAAPRSAVDPGMDALVIIDCFIIVVIGGLGSSIGSFVGALILGFLTIFGSFYLQEWVIVASYAMMVFILIIRPWGLFGQSDEARHDDQPPATRLSPRRLCIACGRPFARRPLSG